MEIMGLLEEVQCILSKMTEHFDIGSHGLDTNHNKEECDTTNVVQEVCDPHYLYNKIYQPLPCLIPHRMWA